jgi:hypothetical protein
MTKQEKKNKKRHLCYCCKQFKTDFVAKIRYKKKFAKKHFKNKKTIKQCSDCLRIQPEKIPDYNLKVIKYIEIL